MSQDLNKIFKQIQKNSEAMGMAAMQSAADKAFQLAKEKALSCLLLYYKKKPKIYKRTKQLKNAITTQSPKLKESGDKCRISFVIKYDASRLVGKYQSNSKFHQSGDEWISRYDEPNKFNFKGGDNGVPDANWILDNYLKGIHPGWRNGKNYGWEDGRENSTDYLMTQFFEKELFEKASDLISEAMTDAVVNFIKTNGGER